MGVLGRTKPFSLHAPRVSSPELRTLLAAYRDGLASTNIRYQVFCFYKIVEGIHKRRDRRGPKGRDNKPEQFPTHLAALCSHAGPTEARKPFGPLLGKRYTAALETFRATMRNAIAHLNPDEPVRDPDNFYDVWQCHAAAPVLRYMAHDLLAAEIAAANPGAPDDAGEVVEPTPDGPSPDDAP